MLRREAGAELLQRLAQLSASAPARLAWRARLMRLAPGRPATCLAQARLRLSMLGLRARRGCAHALAPGTCLRAPEKAPLAAGPERKEEEGAAMAAARALCGAKPAAKAWSGFSQEPLGEMGHLPCKAGPSACMKPWAESDGKFCGSPPSKDA